MILNHWKKNALASKTLMDRYLGSRVYKMSKQKSQCNLHTQNFVETQSRNLLERI